MDNDEYRPVRMDPKAGLERELLNPEFQKAWDAIQEEFSALDALLSAR